MPIYEYRCQACGHEMEAIQRITADALTTCPECEAEELRRLISQTSFVLKGGGWYATDYGGKKLNEGDSGSSSDSGSGSSGDSGGSDSKSAAGASSTD